MVGDYNTFMFIMLEYFLSLLVTENLFSCNRSAICSNFIDISKYFNYRYWLGRNLFQIYCVVNCFCHCLDICMNGLYSFQSWKTFCDLISRNVQLTIEYLGTAAFIIYMATYEEILFGCQFVQWLQMANFSDELQKNIRQTRVFYNYKYQYCLFYFIWTFGYRSLFVIVCN